MSKTILIRDLSNYHSKKLEELKDLFNENTNSKTVLYLIQNYKDKLDELDRLNIENKELRKRNSLLEGFRDNIKYELSLLDSCM